MPNFPIPFPGRLELKGGDLMANPPFVVVSIFTPSHRDMATRLANSLEQLGLPFALYEVPTIHRSINPRGNDDRSYTKANFIGFVLDEYRTSVLYVDCDCVFRAIPKRITALVAEGCDFAIYNWLADEHTDAFLPYNISTPTVPTRGDRARFYRFSHSVDMFAPDQLVCSGAVQFYSNSTAARDLLVAWSTIIDEYPGVLDDICLDYAFNFKRSPTRHFRSSWLDKSYARYLFWIYARPIIDHPQFPALDDPTLPNIADFAGCTARWKTDHAEKRTHGRLFPRDAVIDIEQRLILRPRNTGRADGQIEFVPYAPLYNELFFP